MNCTGWCTPEGEGRWGCTIPWFSSRTECGLCIHVAQWVWSGGRGIKPPGAAVEGCPGAGAALCLPSTAMSMAHAGKCSLVSQQGRAPRLGMLSASQTFTSRLCSPAAHRCDNLVVLTPGREWPALPLPMKSSISSFPPDKHSSHQNFFFNKWHRSPGACDFAQHLCSSNNLPCITDSVPKV